jgi:hypothetical protein
MTALPSNLAFVGQDLARATASDARRSARRRRAVTCSLLVALLALTATAAVANGWLFDETPTLRAVPSLGGGGAPGVFAPRDAVAAVAGFAQSEAQHRAAHPTMGSSPPLGTALTSGSRTLLSDLGSEHRSLTSVPTTSGGVCLELTDFSVQCVPTFKNGQEISWFVGTPSRGPEALYGLARDEVTAVKAVFAGGRTVVARLENNAFYLELASGEPVSLVVGLSDGSSAVLAAVPCPLTNPTCAK